LLSFLVQVENEYEKNWYLGSFDQPDQYDPSRPAVAAWTQFVTAFILYGRHACVRGLCKYE
jgi:hypothetical protein